MQCEYCQEPIIKDTSYTYKWFGKDKGWLPVHTHHLDFKPKKGVKNNELPTINT